MKKILFCFCLLFISMATFSQTLLFKDYISAFPNITTDSIHTTDFLSIKWNINNCIKSPIVNQYVLKDDCGCNPNQLRYYYGKKIVLDNYIIVLMYKHCDLVKYVGYPYQENLIITYTKSGKVIDSKPVTRKGDPWCFNLTGTVKPFKLVVEQATAVSDDAIINGGHITKSTINTYSYTIDKNGFIVQVFLKNRDGGMYVDKASNSLRIVKK